ncbi:hypothetical protein F4677DRAFT_286509 [Hypoxylon crocopeplum]|nr:hypothetical protein F4677DRAFT_286509 [Hypoxylon crocopeplum]
MPVASKTEPPPPYTLHNFARDRSPHGSVSSVSSSNIDPTRRLITTSHSTTDGQPYASHSQPSSESPPSRPSGGGYAPPEAMSVKPKQKHDSCCCSNNGACCFSDHGACCFSDHGACCFSNNGGCCFSDHGGCCFSDDGTCFFNACGKRTVV